MLADQVVKYRQATTRADEIDTIKANQEQLIDQTESPREHMRIIFGERYEENLFNEFNQKNEKANQELNWASAMASPLPRDDTALRKQTQ